MAHPLDGARLKIVRAQEHIDSLKAEIATYLDKRPYEISTQITGDPPLRMPVTTIPPPLRLSTIIGDFVTNVRASLDYIVWELAVRYFSPAFDASDSNDRRITAFPICDSPADPWYVDRLNRLAKRGIPTPAIDEIKTMQPHNRGYESLRWLRELVNTDKHRMPILTISYVPFFVYGRDADGRIYPVPHWGAGRKTTPTPDEIKAMVMEHQVSIHVTFQDVTMPRQPVDLTLEQIIKTAANIIACFDKFFAGHTPIVSAIVLN